MRAVRILLGRAWRRHWRASVFFAVIAGLTAGVIGASVQAARRADTTLERFGERSRTFDLVVQGCPPGTDPASIGGVADTIERCTNPELMRQFRHVLDDLPGVERTALTSTLVVGLLDPHVSNHWGRLTLLSGTFGAGAPSVAARPIIVAGRLPNPRAPDEVGISEAAARVTGTRVGDIVEIAGWPQSDLDAAVDGNIPPPNPVVRSKVVGIGRSLADVQSYSHSTLAEGIPGDFNVFAGPAWTVAHAADFSGYGSAVLVRLRGGPTGVRSFEEILNQMPEGWFTNSTAVNDLDTGSIRRVINLQRNAVLVSAAVAVVAAIVFLGLSMTRQLRRETEESRLFLALGMTRRDLHVMNVLRALTFAILACVVAVPTIVALSPVGPLGLAHKLEFDSGVRIDPLVVLTTVLALAVVCALIGAVTPVGASDPVRASVSTHTSRVDPVLGSIGPVATVGATVARGRASRAAIAVTAVAVAAGVAAGSLIASYDRLVSSPGRYGAWWDVAVGQYSERAAVDDAVAKVRANPRVVKAAGYFEQPGVLKVDGVGARILALEQYVGHQGPVMAQGRAPTTADEVALGRATARRIHKSVGDRVRVVASDGTHVRMRVVGILVVNDPVTADASAGDGAFVLPSTFKTLSGPGGVPQSIVIAVDPRRDRGAAIESVRRDFAGSIREVEPQVAARNLGRLRSVPWLIAALVGFLALATLVHALVTLLGRNRGTLAVLAVLGFVRRQRRGVGLFASVWLVAIGTAIGLPVGLVAGAAVWRAVASSIELPTGTVLAWRVAMVEVFAALALATAVAAVASRRPLRLSPGQQLRVD